MMYCAWRPSKDIPDLAVMQCNNVNMPPLLSGTGKYTTHGTYYAAFRLPYLPIGLKYCPQAYGPLAVLESIGQILQPEGNIMSPLGSILSLIPLAGMVYIVPIHTTSRISATVRRPIESF